jgi:membrane-bound metal-dependent hydrolase YbcI (DUF457 family)
MLPDIDSDSGIPLRETMSFAAAVIPTLLLDRFMDLGLSYEQVVMATGATYLFVRFAVTRLIARYTVHRGMFHSIPALLIFTGLAFLICGPASNLQLRYFKSGGVFLGVLSHLLLDEIFAVEWIGGRWRFKKSFGTALKLWGKSAWANLSAYAKLAGVILLILSEPAIMEHYGQLSPIVINNQAWRDRIDLGLQQAPPSPALPPAGPTSYNQAQTVNPGVYPGTALPQANYPAPSGNSFVNSGGGIPQPAVAGPDVAPTPGAAPATQQRDRTIYDTARRLWHRLAD